MDKLLEKDVSKGRIQDIDAKEARERITVLDYDAQGIKGFRDADMVIEVAVPNLLNLCHLPDNNRRPFRRMYSSNSYYSSLFLRP